jgi:hypothetical protein
VSLSLANPLSFKQLFVLLGADNVAVVSQSRGLRKRILEQKQQKFQAVTESSKSETLIWQQSTMQLDSLLMAMQKKPGTRLNIILASEFVRYLSLPALQIRMSAAEKLGYASATYQDVYGAIANDWEISLQDAPATETTLAAAIDKTLLAELGQIALKHQLLLTSVQPYLMPAFNSLASQIGKASGYLAIVELKRLLLINLQSGKYHNLRAYTADDNWQSELKNLILRDALIGDAEKKEILVYAPAQKNTVLNLIDGWQIKRIGVLKNAVSNMQYSMLEVAL